MWKFIKLLFVLAVVIIIGNYLGQYTRGLPVYHFENQDRSFRYSTMPSKGRTIAMMESSHTRFLAESDRIKEADTLYRTFDRSILKFSNWYHYLTNEHYNYPHKKPSEE